MRDEVARIERDAARLNKQLLVVIDAREDCEYIALGSASWEYERLSLDEFAELRAERGESLLIVAALK